MRTLNQNYLSFVGGFSSKKLLLQKSSLLATNQNLHRIYYDSGFGIVEYSSDNPLYLSRIYKNDKFILFISGFIYSSKQVLDTAFESCSLTQGIQNLIDKLSGSYVIILADIGKQEIQIRSDFFGFEKVFYSHINGEILFSSHIWPLAATTTLDQSVFVEHLTLGHTIRNRTLFKDVKLHQPSFITSVCITKSEIKFIENKRVNRLEGARIEDKCEIFKGLVRKFLDRIATVFDETLPAITLTGGGETRVILNAFLLNDVIPPTITGSYPPNDIIRAKFISNNLGLINRTVNYEDLFEKYWDHIEEVIYLSNGSTNGWWMSLISEEAFALSNLLHYGFSGDLLAGSGIFRIERKDKINKIIRYMKIKSMYNEFDFSLIRPFVEASFDELKESYINSFNAFPDGDDLDFQQEKNEFNFKRVASFADGARIGVAPVFFFHDLEVIKFYRSLPTSFIENEKFHRFFGSYQNDVLANISSAAKTSINANILHLLEKYFGKYNLYLVRKLATGMNHFRQKVSVKNMQEFVSYDLNYRTELESMFDWQNINMHFASHKFNRKDLETIKMRLWDIALTQRLLNNLHKTDVGNIFSQKEFEIIEHTY